MKPTDERDVISLRNWPLLDDPGAACIAAAAIVGAGVAVGGLSGETWAGCAAAGALSVCFWRAWLPVRFEIGPRGVAQDICGRRRLILWRDITGVEVRPRAIIFHAGPTPTRAAALRSLYIRDQGERAAILAFVERFAAVPSRGSSILARTGSSLTVRADTSPASRVESLQHDVGSTETAVRSDAEEDVTSEDASGSSTLGGDNV